MLAFIWWLDLSQTVTAAGLLALGLIKQPA